MPIMLIIYLLIFALWKRKRWPIYTAIISLYIFSTPIFASNFFTLVEGSEPRKTPNEMPIASVPSWGNSNYNGESAVLANLTAANITNPGDGPSVVTASHSEFKSTFNIEIYPNPTNTNILVKTTNDNTKDIEIVNLLGHTLIRQTTKDTNYRIDLSQLVAGCYFIKISTSNDISIHKIIKQ